MNSSTRTSVRVGSPGELAASVPALVGFVPTDSLVVVCMTGSTVLVTMRLDLPESLAEVVDQVTDTVIQVGADAVIPVLYTRPTRSGVPWMEDVHVFCDRLTGAGLLVRDALHVNGDRYWSYLCTQESCCPSIGIPVPAEPSPLTVERVGAGSMAPVGSRDEAVARWTARPDLAPDDDAFKRAWEELPVARRAQADLAWDTLHLLAGEIPDPHVDLDQARALLALLIGDVHVRDYLLGCLATTGDPQALVHALTYTALTAPEPCRDTLAATAAMAMAFTGEASWAVECMLDLAGDQSLAVLVRTAVQIPVHPEQLREVMRDALPVVIERIGQQVSA